MIFKYIENARIETYEKINRTVGYNHSFVRQ